MTAAPGIARPRVGRPRAIVAAAGDATPREQILDAAAALFAAQGYVATTTRQIAERAGIRQSTLYHYARGKDLLLLELLISSVEPTLRSVDELLSRADATAALRALIRIDVDTLTRTPHNVGALYLSPELSAPVFAPFHAARGRLRAAYSEFARRIVPSEDAAYLGAVLIQLVELVIQLRRDGMLTDSTPDDVTRSCLRTLGVDRHMPGDATERGAALS